MMDDEHNVPTPNLLDDGDGDGDGRSTADPILRYVPRTERELEKSSIIEEACQTGDREAISELATSRDGLLNDKIRIKACVYSVALVFMSCKY